MNNQNEVRAADSVRPSLRSIRLYQKADALSGGLLCLMVVFSPWAFGTTQRWSVWVMNICGYSLGLLLLVKLFVRFYQGYRPSRWGGASGKGESAAAQAGFSRFLPVALAILTALILGYCLASALNARATYQPKPGGFVYHECIKWLPHSYDSNSTWRAFWNYLALAFSFWALRDWLLGCSAVEARSQRRLESSAFNPQPSTLNAARSTISLQPLAFGLRSSLPQRLRLLLWLLSLNGALLAVEGICQRISGTNKLLWVMPTHMNQFAAAQFGPYAYRSNGAQYLNLVWPVSLALWWSLCRESRRRMAGLQAPAPSALSPQPSALSSSPVMCHVSPVTPPDSYPSRPSAAKADQPSTFKHHLLLPCVLVMAACPVISASRAGAIIAISMIGAAMLVLMFAMRSRHPLIRFCMVLFFLATLAVGTGLGGDQLMKRMGSFGSSLAVREGLYETGREIARDYPLFGVGPGAFAPMYQIYRTSFADAWPAQLHNDWLETRITFGWVGSSFIGLAFLVVLVRWFAPGGILVRMPFVLLLWLALAGCLVHARFDFPLQIYSILFLFLVLCALLSILSLRTRTSA